MSTEVTYPNYRLNVVAAVETLSDREGQALWGKPEESGIYFDQFDLAVHILLDDFVILPDPQMMVPVIIYQSEVPTLLQLGNVLCPMINDLGDVPDVTYRDDPRWESVVIAAKAAYAVMLANDEGSKSDPETAP